MSNLLYAKSFGNQSGLTVDNIQTTTINNITYSTNANDISGYITGLYQSVGNHNILFDSISGKFNSLTGITNSDKFNFTRYNRTSSYGSYMALDPVLRHLEILGMYYVNGDDIFRKVKIKDYVEITNLSINNPLNATTNYKFYCNGNAYFNGYLDISGNINHKSNLTTNNISCNAINCGTITATGLVSNSISTIGTNGPLIIDPNFTTNNHVLIYDKLVVSGNFENGVNSVQTQRLYGNGNLYIGSNTVLEGGTSIWAANFYNNSDDRIKQNESLITDATITLCKMRGEIYDKYSNFDCSGSFIRETGFVSQEVYNIPEFRHLVGIPSDCSGNLITTQSINPNDDPNYNPNWGTKTPATLNYIGIIPFLVASIQELNSRINY